MLLRLLGSNVEGRLLYFRVALHDFYNLSFANQTIVDESTVCGHYHVHEVLTLEPSRAAGLLHQGTYVLAGSVLHEGAEYGPWRTTVGSIRKDGDTVSDKVQSILSSQLSRHHFRRSFLLWFLRPRRRLCFEEC
mmetsp:Transcript_21784/g.50263  ORF Transcript_21784/g.50263 Transcript_21784/m.50263 type:complete len:134 (+) Transcript_21784:1222-1623(+)